MRSARLVASIVAATAATRAVATLAVFTLACSGAATKDAPPVAASEPPTAATSAPAEPIAAAPPPSAVEAPTPSRPPAAVDAPAPDRMPTKIGEVSEFAVGTPDGTLRQALRCALEITNESTAFDCYAALNVSTNRDTDIALAHLRNYQWKVFRQRASNYVVNSAPFTIKVTRRDPENGDGKHVKIFLWGKARDFPAPITLQKDGGRWWIYTNSL